MTTLADSLRDEIKLDWSMLKGLGFASAVLVGPDYDLLGVTRDVSEKELRLAYWNKAKSLHPDKGGSHEEMKNLNAAFDRVMRAVKRRRRG